MSGDLRTHRSQRGQSTIEYGIVIALVALTVVGILRLLGVSVGDAMCGALEGLGVENERCAEVGELFADDFDGEMNGWIMDRGSDWEQQDGKLCAGPAGEHRAYVDGIDSDRYTVSVDATMTQGNGFGIFFLAKDSNVNGYTFQYDPGFTGPGAFIFRKWINGHEMSPFQPWSQAPSGYQWYNVQRHIEVQVQGNHWIARVDGEVVADIVDDDQPPVPVFETGTAGLRTWSNTKVCFDNFRVTVP